MLTIPLTPSPCAQAFIPDLDFFSGPLFAQTAPASAHSDVFPVNAPVIVHATATKITDGFVELDKDVTANNAIVCLAEHAEGVAGASSHSASIRKGLTVPPRSAKDVLSRRRIPYDYLVYVGDRIAYCLGSRVLIATCLCLQATGCEMPRALAMDSRTKEQGVQFLNVS
jgi:hypothetical protein